ncbi:MAG: histidine--tRNA ligase [Chloroflexi bacterium]|nr:histidine--tRNA ligase [Chloroflexota bacterium]
MAIKERKTLQALRGMVDILPEEQGYWRYVREATVSVCEGYGYGQIDTPILEDYSLFSRGVGEVTDIVEKEMYTITDKGGDTIALRPEATAAVCRAYLEHGLHNKPQPVRLYSVGMPMFRYARPQAGRLRQFHQINVEAIGDADATIDAEVVALCWQLFRKLGLKGLSLQLNSIGDPKCRPGYVEALRSYYSQQEGRLCRECKSRLERNPLRLLDCKVPGCQPLIEGAPRSADYLCEECQAHFQALTRYLGLMEVPFTREHRLVRGLDYYTRTVFEVQTSEEGQQNALGGGGRYDGLIEELGGRPTPGVGFAVGMERVILNLKRQGIEPPASPGTRVFVAYVGQEAKAQAVGLVSRLVRSGVSAMLGPAGKSLKAQLRQAGSMGVPYVLILGDQELEKGVVVLRDMTRREQREVGLEEVIEQIR